jgi:hypothetical protein
MAGRGTLVEARFPPPGRWDEAGADEGYSPLGRYDGPPHRLTVWQQDDLRAILVRGAAEGDLRIPWGTMDSLNDAGSYRRLADGVRSDPGGIDLVVRLVGTSVRPSKRWLEIDVDDGPRYELRRGAVRGMRLDRGGELVAKGFRGKIIEVRPDATPLDAVLVAAVKMSLERMLWLPNVPTDQLVIPGD